MVYPELAEEYCNILRNYFLDPQEQYLVSAQELGRQLVKLGLPPEEIGEIHQDAVKRIIGEPLDSSEEHLFELISNPLLELLLAYGMAHSEKMAELYSHRKKLKKSEAYLRAILDNVSEGIITVNKRLCIRSFNPAAQAIFGYEEDEIIDKAITLLIPEDKSKRKIWKFSNIEPTQKNRYYPPREMPGIRKDGSNFPIEVALRQMQLGANHMGVILVRDLTEIRNLQANKIQNAKMVSLGKMATGIAHELNQPLSIIRMSAENMLELINTNAAPIEKIETKLNQIIVQIDRSASIIDHMRIFGRKRTDKVGRVDLEDTVLKTKHLVGQEFELKGIEIQTDFPEDKQWVKGEQDKIEQVIISLLMNSKDAFNRFEEISEDSFNRHKKIFIGIEGVPSNDEIKLIYRDNAGGIPEDILAHIFEPFFTTKNIGEGTGLGLSISYGAITEMGGSIVASNVEEGAQFTISLVGFYAS